MSTVTLVAVCGFCVLAGIQIGVIGIGGILVVPVLVYIGGIDIHVAIAAAMFSYMFSGVVGATVYTRYGSVRWPDAVWLFLGALPASFVGAWAANALPKSALELVIAGFAILAGINALRPGHLTEGQEIEAGRPGLTMIGSATGFASALTGTAGPMVLVPSLLWLRYPVLAAVGLSQAIQLPIALLATAGNLVYGQLDLGLGAAIAVGLAAGTAVGAHVAHRIPRTMLQKIVAVVLIVFGSYIAFRVFYLSP